MFVVINSGNFSSTNGLCTLMLQIVQGLDCRSCVQFLHNPVTFVLVVPNRNKSRISNISTCLGSAELGYISSDQYAENTVSRIKQDSL